MIAAEGVQWEAARVARGTCGTTWPRGCGKVGAAGAPPRRGPPRKPVVPDEHRLAKRLGWPQGPLGNSLMRLCCRGSGVVASGRAHELLGLLWDAQWPSLAMGLRREVPNPDSYLSARNTGDAVPPASIEETGLPGDRKWSLCTCVHLQSITTTNTCSPVPLWSPSVLYLGASAPHPCAHGERPPHNPIRSPKGIEGLVQLGGLEPPTSCSTDRRSNQLSYNCIRRAASGRRTERGGN